MNGTVAPPGKQTESRVPSFADEQARRRFHMYVEAMKGEGDRAAPPRFDPTVGAMLFDSETTARLDASMPWAVARPKGGRKKQPVTRGDLRKVARRQKRVNRSLFDRIEEIENAVAVIAAEVAG